MTQGPSISTRPNGTTYRYSSMSARAHGGIGFGGPRGGCRGGGSSGGGGSGNAARRRARRRNRNPLDLAVFIDLPPNLRGAVIGRQGCTVKAIQESSGALVKIPPAGRNGRVRVQGVEVSLLAACHSIALAVTTRRRRNDGEDATEDDLSDSLDCTIDAGRQLGRFVGKLYLHPQSSSNNSSTLICRAENPPAATATSTSNTTPTGIVYAAHAIPTTEVSSITITQEDVDITLDNFAFARGGDGDDMPVSACLKNDHIFVSGFDIDNIVDAVADEVKRFIAGANASSTTA